jgi:hypothetical protein
MTRVAPRTQRRSSCSKDNLVYISCCIYVQSTLVYAMSQNLVDDGSEHYNVVYMFIYFAIYICV